MSFAPQPTTSTTTGTTTAVGSSSKKEYFPEVPKRIPYKGIESTDPLSYRYYNPDEIIHGKTMKEWLRFSVCYWHTFRGNGSDPFGFPTMIRSWDDGSNTIDNAKRRVDVAFEFFSKLGVEYYTFHDRDVAPEGTTLEETNAALDEIVPYLEMKQKQTGIKLLWSTQNLFSHPRYMNGAFTNPDVHIYAYAASQVKKVMDINHRLGGENLVFWGGREGYQSLLNTNMKRELDHMAKLFHMAVEYKERKGMEFQLLVEPKPREPMKHQYDYDAATTLNFLSHYNLTPHFKLNIEPNHTTLAGHDYEHDIVYASQYNMLGSIDSNSGDTLLGWDTDQFPMDIKKAAMVMGVVLDQDGGLGSGGLNFDCKVRRESIDPIDLFIGHIGAMDTFAKGLRIASKIKNDGVLEKMVKERYDSWDTTELGKKIEESGGVDKVMLEDCEDFVKENGEPKVKSGKQELYEMILNRYL